MSMTKEYVSSGDIVKALAAVAVALYVGYLVTCVAIFMGKWAWWLATFKVGH